MTDRDSVMLFKMTYVSFIARKHEFEKCTWIAILDCRLYAVATIWSFQKYGAFKCYF
ncbi:hypothetical protein RchiOBHm_Chr2g0089971 [Rosa chinensis]|uniref:Uncharacterized protein n=1 Tax=Rosa chinensis TaxID=74649 RepID=A0A2P6RJD4_ROSCH|nr:hypothetical protein RchiOBHm_Chr2g0089971 [Rosa chinensis]